MAKEKRFKAGIYGVIAAIVVAAILVGLTIYTFTSRYNAFSPEKVAQSYADTIVQSGDGYNALKVSLVSKNQKFGDFVINGYMLPYVNDGDDVEKNPEIGTGSTAEQEMLDNVTNQMYDYFLELQSTVGLQNYNTFYSLYFAKLKEVRTQVIQDDYMDTEYMFSVFETNVTTYGESLTGTEEKLADDDKTVLKEASTGKYQEMYGEDYKLTTTVVETTDIVGEEKESIITQYNANQLIEKALAQTKSESLKDEESKTKMIEAFTKLDVSADITDIKECKVEVTNQNGDVVATVNVYVAKIGNSWYVDNVNTDTSSLYLVK